MKSFKKKIEDIILSKLVVENKQSTKLVVDEIAELVKQDMISKEDHIKNINAVVEHICSQFDYYPRLLIRKLKDQWVKEHLKK